MQTGCDILIQYKHLYALREIPDLPPVVAFRSREAYDTQSCMP